MTVEDMLVDVWEQLGEDTTLDPYNEAGDVDITTSGAVKCLGWLNRAYYKVTNWKLRDNSYLRFRALYGAATVTMKEKADLTVTGSDVNSVTVSEFDHVEVNVPAVLVRSDDLRVLTVGETAGVGTVTFTLIGNPFSVTAGDTLRMLRNDYGWIEGAFTPTESEYGTVTFPGASNLITVQRLTDITENGFVLDQGFTTDSYYSSAPYATGIPRRYNPTANGVLFDKPIEGSRTYLLDFYKLPDSLTALADVPAIPAPFQEAMVLWATWWGLRRRQEYTSAYATKRDLDDMMENTVKQGDFEFDRVSGQMIIGGR
jgi:hypothetical protein